MDAENKCVSPRHPESKVKNSLFFSRQSRATAVKIGVVRVAEKQRLFDNQASPIRADKRL